MSVKKSIVVVYSAFVVFYLIYSVNGEKALESILNSIYSYLIRPNCQNTSEWNIIIQRSTHWFESRSISYNDV